MDGVVLLSGWSTLCVKLLLALIPYTPAPSGDPTDHTDQLIGVNIGGSPIGINLWDFPSPPGGGDPGGVHGPS